MRTLALTCALLTMTLAEALAQTNLDYWVQKLDISLTGLTDGKRSTNGIIATAKVDSMKFNSKEIVQLLSRKPAFVLGKGYTNFTVVVTNHVDGPDTYTTNEVTMAIPVFTPIAGVSYSEQARLFAYEPLGTNEFGTLIVIREPGPSTEYVVNNYFQTGRTSFDGRTNDFVVAGRFELAHDLISATESGVEILNFDDNAFAAQPPTGTHVEVQGFTQRQVFSLREKGQVVDNNVTRSATMNAAGTGQLGNTNTFAVFRGTVKLTGGKHETK